ncbi:tetratricopeptide repeat protein [Nodosilinea sp. FACHB-131]|uniref:tetratricopeptide repeat protein n=1 Tax=Cyanophyceae TaxID=3028117 RepID=UPI0016854135|nr:tetratricopeptide repeat protein [Nodosilinea sp. FACHB-131]MBD1876439.1 tetratricopeptide repeat protein [Nodosilinea sp. FACHB-131]
MLLPSLRFTKPLLLSIALPLALLTPVAVPLTQAQETPSEIDPTNIQRNQEANRLLDQGMDQFDADQYQAALQSFQAALERFRQNGDRYYEASVLNMLGIVYDSMGQSQQAIESYEQALSIGQAFGVPELEAAALYNLGVVYASINQPQQAVESYQQALPLYRETGDRYREMMSLALIAEALIAQNQTDLAIDYFGQSVEVFAAIRAEQIDQAVYIPSDFELLKEPYHRYVELLNQQNRPQEAQQVLDLIKEIEFVRDEEADRLLGQGFDQLNANQYQAALQSFQAALERFRQNEDRSGETETLLNLGLVYDSMGQPQQAIESYQQALSIGQAIGAPSLETAALSSLGNVYASINQPQQAIESYQQALLLYQREQEIRPLTRQWEIRLLMREGEMWSLISIAKVLIAQNQTDLASDYFGQSVDVFAAIRAEQIAQNIYIPSNFESLKEPYHRYAELLSQHNRPQEAQQVLDLIREVESR